MKKIFLLTTCLFTLFACSNGLPRKLEIEMKDVHGDSLGKIMLEEKADGMNISGDLEGLPPGQHAFHIHNKGVCEIPDFLSAGDHFNPDDKEHGLLNPKGPHAGDLPNLIVDEEGKANVDFTVGTVTLKEEGNTTLYTQDGTSLVIHEGPDDGMTQPAGNGGGRIACGEITKDRKPIK